MDQTPSAVNISSYAKIVADKALVRNLIATANKLSDRGYAQEYKDVETFMDEAEAAILIWLRNELRLVLVDASEFVKASLQKLEELYAQKI